MATNTVIYSCQQVPKPCDIIIKIISIIIIIIIMTTTIMYKSLGVWDPNVSDFSRHPGENKHSVYHRRSEGCSAAFRAQKQHLMFLLLQIVVKMDFRSVVSGQLQEYLCWCVF